MKTNKFWIIVVSAFFALCVLGAAAVYLFASEGQYAVICQNGAELYRLDLGRDIEVTVPSEDGGYNIIKVQNGAVSVIEADCRDQICVLQGEISDNAAPIVCLPHGLVIEVTAESDIDAVG